MSEYTQTDFDCSIVHAVPGLGKPLEYIIPTEDDPVYSGRAPLATALVEETISSSYWDTFETELPLRMPLLPILTVREIRMLRFMSDVTDDADWRVKVFGEDLVEKWREDVVVQGDASPDFTNAMFDYCIAELRWKARNLYQSPHKPVAVYNGDVVKSDTAVPEETRLALRDAIAEALENVPDRELDSGEPGTALRRVVDPNLFPLVYGKTRVLEVGERAIGLEDAIDRCGDGVVLELKKEYKPAWRAEFAWDGGLESYSDRFQWLPCEVDVSGDQAKIASYINNLHPRFVELYKLIEKVADGVIPLWESALAVVYAQGDMKIVYGRRIRCNAVRYVDGEEVDVLRDGEDDEVYEDNLEDAEGGAARPLETIPQRDAPIFDPVTLPLPPAPVSFKELYGKRRRPLQVIIKMDSIELTPEKPKYEGGSEGVWCHDGKQNERICAMAHYCFSSHNIKSQPYIAFQQIVNADIGADIGYSDALDDPAFLGEVFGCENEEAAVQEVGKVEMKEGRLIAFPNILQYQVQPVELEDPTKEGRMKIMTLFLVDPNVRIISTAHVPPQRLDWWREAIEGSCLGLAGSTGDATARAFGKLPIELKDKIFNEVEGFPIALDEAKIDRDELVKEWEKFVRQHAMQLGNSNSFFLPED